MKWFDNPKKYYGGSNIAKKLVIANYRIHHLESRLRRANNKAARLHQAMKESKTAQKQNAIKT